MPIRSAPATKLDLPEVTTMPFTEASPAARSMAASNSSTNSCPIDIHGLAGLVDGEGGDAISVDGV